MNKIRVLHVGEIVKGGVATYVSTLLTIDEDIENFFILSSNGSNKKWEIDGEHLKYYPYKRSMFGFIKAIYYIKKYILEIRPDVIYCHSTWAGVMTRFIFFFSKKTVKIIYNAHGWSFLRDDSRVKKAVYKYVEKILSYKTDVIINVSKNEFKKAEEIGIDKVRLRLIYSGIEAKKNTKNKMDFNVGKINILFVGRFDKPKGVDYLLEKFAKVKRNDLNLYLIGDFVIDSREINRDSYPNNVIFVGWKSREEIFAYYQSADVIIVPSRWEAFGLVAVEAMMCSKPVIVSNRGALPELVKPEYNGYIFDMNDKNSLVDILESLDKCTLKELGKNALIEYKLKYDDRLMKEKTREIYRLLKGGIK